MREGIDCCPFTHLCGGLPMYKTARSAVLHGAPPWLGELDFDHYPGRVFGGPQIRRLSHRSCNRSAGGTLGNKLKATPGWVRTTPRQKRARGSGPRNNAARRRRWGI